MDSVASKKRGLYYRTCQSNPMCCIFKSSPGLLISVFAAAVCTLHKSGVVPVMGTLPGKSNSFTVTVTVSKCNVVTFPLLHKPFLPKKNIIEILLICLKIIIRCSILISFRKVKLHESEYLTQKTQPHIYVSWAFIHVIDYGERCTLKCLHAAKSTCLTLRIELFKA